MILGKIILDMFSARTRYIAARAAIRYKKDGNLTKSVFFDATVIKTCGLLPAPIIDAERVCKLACKRAEDDCSTSVVYNTTRCKAQSIKQSADA